jgi:large subunit ribosomal protein L3
MIEGLIGRKVGMTRIFKPTGQVIPVTVVEAGPCYVTQLKTQDKDGYLAVQLGYGAAKRANKPEKGHLKQLPALKSLREFRTDDPGDVQIGQVIDVSIFEAGDKIDIVGTSKGKGYAGVVKRHHFAGGPRTHGQSDRLRAPGSVGSTTTPGRVLKGLRMSGRMGGERVTVQNLEVVEADKERNLLIVKGAIPGPRNGLLIIKKARKAG